MPPAEEADIKQKLKTHYLCQIYECSHNLAKLNLSFQSAVMQLWSSISNREYFGIKK